MRVVSILALAALLASPALAQTQYADSSGVFVSLNGFSFGSDNVYSVDGSLGYRFSNGVDLGARYNTGNSSLGSGGDFHRFGPVVGITRPLGSGFIGRAEGTVQFSTFGGLRTRDFTGRPAEPFNVRVRDIHESVSVTAARRVPIVGSLAVQPTLGGYVAGIHRLTFEVPGLPPAAATSTQIQLGMQVDVPITFRLFGQDAAIVTGGRLPFNLRQTGIDNATYVSGGFRLNF